MEIELGTVTCPSGRLVIADTGYLGLWSGDAAPVADADLLAGITDPALRESVANAADLEIVGPDAERAARSFDRQSGTWLYDIPAHGVPKIVESFEAHCREHGLDARVERLPGRVPHRERAERAARAGGDGFIMQGVPVVVAPLPAGSEPRVTGTRRDYGRVGVRWETITVHVSDAAPVASRRLDTVGVDAARLSLVDADALGSWRHDEPLDGLADVAFWGRSQEEAAARFDAPPLGRPGEEGVRGWTDLDVPTAVERAMAVQEWADASPERLLAVDFRPHSHHFEALSLIRATVTGSGVIEVGGARTLAFATSWGDGLYPVHADFDASGRPARIRIALGDEERARRLEELHDRLS
ncbi:hypothetical protein ACSNOI_21820 [Actinomadura kijaniata]|uniref:hypothetical protein n=1 Tax=Actinomadura kijaniata TaxID=46161 RepID=UPI003F1B4476